MNTTEVLFRWFVSNEVNNQRFKDALPIALKYHTEVINTKYYIESEHITKKYMNNYKVQQRRLIEVENKRKRELSEIVKDLKIMREIGVRFSQRFNNESVKEAASYMNEYIEKNIKVKSI